MKQCIDLRAGCQISGTPTPNMSFQDPGYMQHVPSNIREFGSNDYGPDIFESLLKRSAPAFFMPLQTDCGRYITQIEATMYYNVVITLLDACLSSYIPHEKGDD